MLRPCSVPEKLARIRSSASDTPSTASLAASLIAIRGSSTSLGFEASEKATCCPPSKSTRASASSAPSGAQATRFAAKRSGVRGSNLGGSSPRSSPHCTIFSPATPSVSVSSSAGFAIPIVPDTRVRASSIATPMFSSVACLGPARTEPPSAVTAAGKAFSTAVTPRGVTATS